MQGHAGRPGRPSPASDVNTRLARAPTPVNAIGRFLRGLSTPTPTGKQVKKESWPRHAGADSPDD